MKVAFLKGEGFTAKLVKWWTKGPYDHCALVFSDGVSFSSSLQKDMYTQFERINFNTAYWDVLDVPMSAEDEHKVRSFCINEMNCRYDWVGIFLSQIIPLGYNSKSKWFCSEVCVAALQKANLLLNEKPNRVSPNKLYKLLASKVS